MEILIGLIAGLGTSIGIGGGTILILFLTLFLGLEQRMAQAVNLICFIPASIISIIYNLKKKNINLKNAFPILISGILGALVGSYISQNVNIPTLKKLFAIFLLFIAVYEIYDLYKFIKSK